MFRKKFKKAYVSIEAVILASIIVIGGIAALSAFLKNGQGAQAQSASAINNTIDMIGEEFNFEAGNGGLPGGGGGESGGLTDELNEYGFYFGQEYRHSISEGGVTSTSKAYYYEDGSGFGQTTHSLVENAYLYSYKSLYGYGLETVTVSEDGLTLTLGNGRTLKAVNAPAVPMNEHGFYYDVEYKATYLDAFGAVSSYRFYEDGSGVLVSTRSYPAGTLVYSRNEILVGGTTLVTFSENGKKATLGGIVYTLVE